MKAKRGDIWWVDFDPVRGSEQAGKRPAVVIQNDIGNTYSSTTIVVALSTNLQNYPQNVILCPSSLNNLTQKSCLKGAQVLTISQDRLIQKMGILDSCDLIKVDEALILSLGLK